MLPQLPLEEQQFPNVEPRQVLPALAPHLPLVETGRTVEVEEEVVEVRVVVVLDVVVVVEVDVLEQARELTAVILKL